MVLSAVEEIPFVAGYAVDIGVEGITVEDLVLLEDGLGLLSGFEIGALDACSSTAGLGSLCEGDPLGSSSAGPEFPHDADGQ